MTNVQATGDKTKTSRATMLEKAKGVCDRSKEIEELSHQLSQGLLGQTVAEIKKKEGAEKEATPPDLFNQTVDYLDGAEKAQRIAVERLNYLIQELCE